MRKFFFVTMLALALSFTAMAQDAPKAQVFGGYQWTNVDFGGGVDRQNFNGWNAAVDGYFNKNFGITADFSGAYGSPFGADSVRFYTYMFGPTVRVPMDKVTPFVHALFGGVHGTAKAEGVSFSDSAFAYALGGGLDVNAHKNFAIRIAQFDYLGSRFGNNSDFGSGSSNQNNFRYSAGVVFKF